MPTTRRNQTGNTRPVRNIPPNGTSGGLGGGGGPGGGGAVNRPAASPTGPAPLVGEPEFLPQHTFISQAMLGDNGFIANAINYHTISGLNPRTVGSIEEILELLNTPATGTGVLDRIRIVSHFFVTDPGESEQPSNMGINFLRNGGRGALKRYFDGFTESSIAGLRSLLVFEVGGGQSHTFVFTSPETLVLSELRGAGSGAVVDAVFPSGGTPSDNKKEFVILHASKWLLAHNATGISDATLQTNLATAYDLILADLRTKLTAAPDNVPGAQLDALATAIANLGDLPGASFATPPTGARYAANVTAGVAAATGDTFRNKLLAVRSRFDRFTTIDIRGCRAGTDIPYLQSVQRFFGRSTTVRPVVTGPNWFQRFNKIAAPQPYGTTPQAGAAIINGLHNSGLGSYSATQIRDQFALWADGFGITAAHLTFWHTTFQFGVLEFSRLQWRGSIPARKVTIPRLDNLPGAAFANIFNLLGDIFFVRVSDRPTVAQLTTIAPTLPNLNMWITQLNATINAGASAAELTTHFNNFKTIYEAVEARMANASFHNSPQRTIPATQPAGLTVAQAVAFQTNLKTFIQSNTNSILAPVRVFLTAADANTQDAPARMRYFLALGLVFQLADTTATAFDAQQIVYFDDKNATGRHTEAIRHWIRSAWRGVAPPNIPANLDFDLAHHSSWFVAGRQQGPSAVCPHRSYMLHIITEPA